MKINTFTAIDFETAQGKRNSICQVGIVRVVEGEISSINNTISLSFCSVILFL